MFAIHAKLNTTHTRRVHACTAILNFRSNTRKVRFVLTANSRYGKNAKNAHNFRSIEHALLAKMMHKS